MLPASQVSFSGLKQDSFNLTQSLGQTPGGGAPITSSVYDSPEPKSSNPNNFGQSPQSAGAPLMTNPIIQKAIEQQMRDQALTSAKKGPNQ
jgi:hypothetical protein